MVSYGAHAFSLSLAPSFHDSLGGGCTHNWTLSEITAGFDNKILYRRESDGLQCTKCIHTGYPARLLFLRRGIQ